MVAGFVTWLVEGGVGPALAALPVNWTGEALANHARNWFRRIRETDDLSRLVRAAVGPSIELTRVEFDAMRDLLANTQTWSRAGSETVDDLAALIEACLQPQEGRTAEDAHTAAVVIVRGLLECAVADLEPELFQRLLLTRLRRMETGQATALDGLLLELQGDLAVRFAGMMEQFKRVLDRLPPGVAQRGEIAVYLRTVVDWLGSDPWPHDPQFGGPILTPAAIERRLGVGAQVGSQDTDADELGQRCRRLVILGGPGSGKTWLAKRMARRCAEEALEALAGGAAPDDVELPLFTTCSRLSRAAGDIRHAVVSSALEQVGDFGGSRLTAALRAFFTERNAPTLVVIDSLDEANGADDRLRQAGTLPWRIVVTSRPSSWDHQLAVSVVDDSQRVAELRPLRYPDDVEAFIGNWFGSQPARGADLVAQIARRPDLQEAATVPLLLAFFCIVGGGAPLPELGSDLYAKVINRLLTGRWRGRHDRHPDIRACLAALRAWAWSGIARHPVTGLGIWEDEISCESAGLLEVDSNAVNHVATPMSPPDVDSGKIMRRFIHRLIREHLVAEHVAGLGVDQAAEVLLPHLWYDPDWENAAPAAIAMHPQHDQLLQTLICQAARSDLIPEDLSVIDGGRQFQTLLARVAAESSEERWTSEMAAIIGEALVQVAGLGWTYGLTRGSPWGNSIYEARQSLLGLLANAHNGQSAHELTDAVVEFAVTGEDKRQARKILLGLLAQAGDRPGGDRLAIWLAPGVARLDPTAEEKHQARQALLRLLAHADNGWVAQHLALAVAGLDPTTEEKHKAREALLGLLRRTANETSESDAGELIGGLAEVATTAEEICHARRALLGLVAEVNGQVAIKLMAGVARFATTTNDKREARQALIRLLARADRLKADWIVDWLADLNPTAEDKRQACKVMLRLLAEETFHSQATVKLVSGITSFTHTTEDKREVRDALLGLLANQIDAAVLGELVTGVTELATNADDKHQVLHALLEIVANPASDQGATALASGVTELATGADDKRHARRVLLEAMAEAASGQAAVLIADAVARLDPTGEDKRHARVSLVSQLASEADPWIRQRLAETVARLDPTAEDRRQVREALVSSLCNDAASGRTAPVKYLAAGLAAIVENALEVREVLFELLAGTDSGQMADQLAGLVISPDLTAYEQRQVRQTLLSLLAREADPWTGRQLAERVVMLDPSAQDKRQVRKILLSLLSHTHDVWIAWQLTETVAGLDPTAEDKFRVREVVISLLGGNPAVRRTGILRVERAGSLIGILAGLDPEQKDIRQISEIVSGLLADNTGSFLVKALVDEVTQPTTPRQAKDHARQILLGSLTDHAYSNEASTLVRGVLSLDPTAEDKRRARESLLSQPKYAAPYEITHALIDAAKFDLTAEEKRSACGTLLDLLSRETSGLNAAILARAIPRFEPTADDKRQARRALLRLLPGEAQERYASELINLLLLLDPSSHDLSTAESWAALPTRRLLAAARRNSTLDAWLTILPSLALLSSRVVN